MLRHYRLAVVAAVALSMTAASRGQQTQPPPANPPQPPQPTFRTGVNVVRVDAIVTRRGKPVTDLTAGDFTVLEEGVPQEITSFRLVTATGEPAPGADPPRPINTKFDEETEALREDVRLFAIFLDEYHVLRGRNTILGREAVAKFVRTRLGSNDLVALMYPFTSVRDLRFTRDRNALADEIMRFEGRRDDFFPRRPFEAQHMGDIQRIRNQVSLSALQGLVTHLGSLSEGRKTVILLSEGFPTRAGYGSAGFFDSTYLHDALREVYTSANRTNTAIYPLDPTGLGSGGYAGELDSLRVLADETDGVPLVNRNDLEGALEVALADAGAYYLIGYSSTYTVADGKFREIKVRVNRPGVDVRARKGYVALTAAEHASFTAPPPPGPPAEVLGALDVLAAPIGGLPLLTWIGAARSADGRMQVTFSWERGTGPAVDRVVLVAKGEDGTEHFRGPVAVAESAPSGTPASTGGARHGPASVTFAAPPGRLDLTIETGTGTATRTETQTFDVPDPAATALTIDTPVVVRAQNAFELRKLRESATVAPAASREFRRTDRVLVRFAARGPSGQPEVAVQLLNRMGHSLSVLPVTSLTGAGSHEVELPLTSLAPGEYVVEIRATAGDASARAHVGFRLLP